MLKRKLFWIGVLIIVIMSSIMVTGNSKEGNVYVIPIKEEITPAMYQYVKHNLNIIEKDSKAVAVIFEIDTYGGRIDSAEKISQLILNAEIPTISFVNTKAESAGVLLTISSDTIAMAPSGTIGSAETIPNTEKVLSTWVSMLRSVAQEKGRDEEIVVAMADRFISIPGIIEKGRLLNLTTIEAENLGFADIITKNYEEILSSLSIPYDNIIMGQTTNSIRLAHIINNSYVAPILLTIGFLGILVEIFTTGFGLAGTVSLISFTLYFGGNILAGNTGWLAVLIFLAGLILLAIEAFVPGFGIPGIGGIICIIISIVLASNSAVSAIISLLISFILTIIIFTIILKYAPRSSHFNRIVLKTRLDKDKGYVSSRSYEEYLGRIGVVTTPLRPAGTMSIDEELLDVVSEGQFINKGQSVKIIRVEGRRIVVQKIN